MTRNYTTTLPVHTTPRHIHLRPTTNNSAETNRTGASRSGDDALRMDLVLRRHGGASGDGRFSARGKVALPGRDIEATAVHADLYTAIVKLIGRLVRRSGARKPRNREASASRDVRTNGSRPRYAKLTPERGSSGTHGLRTSAQVKSAREKTITKDASAAIPGRSPVHVLLAIDYSDPAAAVSQTGAALAAKTGARLTLLHVLEPVAHEPAILAHWIDLPKQRRHYAAARLRSWSKHHASTGRISCKVEEGRPWEEIVRVAKAAGVDLIVMGRSGTRWFGRTTARTVERVVQHAPCPVLIVGQDQQHTTFEPRRIVVTTDFSAGSREALPWADRIAREYGAQIVMANVQEPMGLPGTLAYAWFHEEIDALRRQADSKLEALRHAQLSADLEVETRVMEGMAVPALCRLVKTSGADLVVMSTHGEKGWVRKWLGGTTEGVLRNVTCSVLVVPARLTKGSTAAS